MTVGPVEPAGVPSESSSLVDRLKHVHRAFPTGVTIVTTVVDDRPYGLAVNAFASVSLSPPLVLVCVARTSETHERLLVSNDLAVNFLSGDQRDVAARFARSGGEKFNGISWHPGACGSPVIDGVAAHLELEIEQRVLAHTHTIFVGRVLEAVAYGRAPLIYVGGGFHDGAELGSGQVVTLAR